MVRYFDQAATSYPKPPEVIRAVADAMEHAGGNPGRSGHRLSVAAQRIVEGSRRALADLLGVPDDSRLIFTRNATQGLNLVLKGILRPGHRVVTTSLEHNAVMRPLRSLERRGVRLTVVGARPDGTLDLEDWEAALRRGADVAVFTHGSNVVGTVLPLAEMAALARRHGARVVVDAAQTVGCVPLDVAASGADAVAFTGHKALLGPQGTGGVWIAPDLEVDFWEEGGTGSRSDEELQPEFYPDRFESGTPNTPGIAGLGAGVRYTQRAGLESIRRAEEALVARFLDRVGSIRGVTLYGPRGAAGRLPVVSLNVGDADPAEVSLALDEGYGILTRPGLHCAPAAHRTIGTFPRGTVRFSFDYRTTEEDIEAAAAALAAIARATGAA